jgi:hypothetical protein
MSVNSYFILTLLMQPEYEYNIVFLDVSSEMAFLIGFCGPLSVSTAQAIITLRSAIET